MTVVINVLIVFVVSMVLLIIFLIPSIDEDNKKYDIIVNKTNELKEIGMTSNDCDEVKQSLLDLIEYENEERNKIIVWAKDDVKERYEVLCN